MDRLLSTEHTFRFKAKMANFYIFLLLVIVSSTVTHACEQHKTCSDCIRDIGHCVWCSSEEHIVGARCKGSITNNWCNGHTFDPNVTVKTTENLEYSSVKGHIVQIKPQKMDISIRAGKTASFEFTFKRVKDYPVDIYFLLDASKSMAGIKHITVKQSKKIFEVMYNLTSDVNLGLGTFVDKNSIPFVNTKDENMTYSFINRLRLSEDYTNFAKVLNETNFGENFDYPEGIFDGLAQVYACPDEIGWRNQTRKIVVVLTDGTAHSAGDGRYAGIIRPYDGKCYTQDGKYTRELDMDYPSLYILNKLASQEEIVTIFAVKDTATFKYFKKVISGTHVADLSKENKNINDDSNIIVDILSSIYNEISDNLNFKVIMDPKYQEHFEISLKPDCGKEECKIHINEEKKIAGTIKLLKYTDDVDIPIDIAVGGIKEQLKLNININKACDTCGIKKNSISCSKNGDQVCGVCECNSGRYGSSCECSTTDMSNRDPAPCKAPNSTKICSGFGNCRCGLCECITGYNGKYCECNTQKCPIGANRGLCSNNGNCSQEICGKCKCEPLWSADDCSCSTLKTNCIDEDTHKECNDRGQCICNACKCPHLADWDARIDQDTLCQPIPSSQTHSRQCLLSQPCVLGFLQNDASHCNSINISGVAHIQDLKETKGWMICEGVRADVGCNTVFLYMYNKDKYQIDVIVQKELNCVESYYILGGGCLAGLIAIGIITLAAWKYITDKRDRAEYDRFNKALEGQSGEWENPTYAPATTSFSNPAYKRSFRK